MHIICPIRITYIHIIYPKCATKNNGWQGSVSDYPDGFFLYFLPRAPSPALLLSSFLFSPLLSHWYRTPESLGTCLWHFLSLDMQALPTALKSNFNFDANYSHSTNSLRRTWGRLWLSRAGLCHLLECHFLFSCQAAPLSLLFTQPGPLPPGTPVDHMRFLTFHWLFVYLDVWEQQSLN